MNQCIEELSPCINTVDDALTSTMEALGPLLECPLADPALKLSPLQRAKLDVISLYASNALFWVYLKTQGVNPATHGLMQELERVKSYITRLKDLEDKKLILRVDQTASKRVLRNALWSAAHKSKRKIDTSASAATSADHDDSDQKALDTRPSTQISASSTSSGNITETSSKRPNPLHKKADKAKKKKTR